MRGAGTRAALALAVALPVLVVTAPAASAAGWFVDPPPEVVAEHAALRLVAEVDELEPDRVELRATGPGLKAPVVLAALPRATEVGPRRVEAALTTDACTLAVCDGAGTAANGGYRLTLVAVQELGDQVRERALASHAFALDVPAKAPEEVAARRLDDGLVEVSWARGTEPDVVAWAVDDGEGVTRQVDPSDAGACADGRCATVLRYTDEAQGERTFAVTATRRCGTPDCRPVPSAAASSEPVALQGPPEPSAAATPSAGAGPTPTGTSTPRPTRFPAAEPGVGAPRLPSLPDRSAPSVAAPRLPDGTYGPVLDYGEQTEVEVEPVVPPQTAGREGTVLTSTGGLLDDEAVVRGIAAALVLLLSGAHLRTWLARTRDDG